MFKEYTNEECKSLVGSLIYISDKFESFHATPGTYLIIDFKPHVEMAENIICLDRIFSSVGGWHSFNKYYLNYVEIL